ncbi:MAG: hypothetical protein AAF571_01965 [Verrucomicrobiota bacterium]
MDITYQNTTEFRTTSESGSECLLTFTIAGDLLEGALDAGRWKIEEALDNQGLRLEIQPGYSQNFTPLIKHRGSNGTEATVKLGLSLPPRSTTSIRSLKGSLGINIYRKQVVIINDLEKNLNKIIENPLFKAHGFTVQIIDPQHAYPGYTSAEEQQALYSRAVALRIEGEIDKVSSFKIIDSEGNELGSRPAGFGAGRSRIMARMADEALQDGTTIHLQIPIDPQETRIPFSFSEIPLP